MRDIMPMNFFITGMPKTGKTTLLTRLVEDLRKKGLKVGGFVSPEEKEHGTREGFYVEDLETGKKALLASIKGNGPKISKYFVDIKSFESVALPSMKKVDSYDVFVLDEIGRMEMKSSKFVDLLDRIFESPTPVIASINQDYVEKYGFSGETLILTRTNREAVYMDLMNKATEEYVKKKGRKKPEKKPPKKAAKQKKAKVKKPAKPKAKPKPKRKVKKAKKVKKEKKPKPAKKGVLKKIADFLGI